MPVFAEDRITLQSVRTCQQVFSAAFIGHVEAAYDDEAHKNELCTDYLVFSKKTAVIDGPKRRC